MKREEDLLEEEKEVELRFITGTIQAGLDIPEDV